MDVLLGKGAIGRGGHYHGLVPAEKEAGLEWHAYFVRDFLEVGVDEEGSLVGKSQLLKAIVIYLRQRLPTSVKTREVRVSIPSLIKLTVLTE